MYWSFRTALAVFLTTLWAIGLLAWLAAAHGHDWKRPEFDDWYARLKKPTGFQCCSTQDCHETDAEIRGGEWWARIAHRHAGGSGEIEWTPGAMVKVPPTAVLLNQSNPTGSAVICHSIASADADPNATVIWCFIPPSES